MQTNTQTNGQNVTFSTRTYVLCPFLPVNNEKLKAADRGGGGGVGESGGGSVFFDLCSADFSHINAPWSSFSRQRTRWTVTALFCRPPPGSFPPLPLVFLPPISRLFLLSSGSEATRLTANREGLPWETERGSGGGVEVFYLNLNLTLRCVSGSKRLIYELIWCKCFNLINCDPHWFTQSLLSSLIIFYQFTGSTHSFGKRQHLVSSSHYD